MSAEREQPAQPDPASGEGDDARRAARRALLRRAVYSIPAVLGTFAVARNAAAQSSCLPNCSCQPNCCFPDINCLPWLQ
ncbi:MAG: hypothetical protein ACYTGX_09955 [Planctomycetota bacterium]|jgi:hypothetical protein